jgi:hypothetical protein
MSNDTDLLTWHPFHMTHWPKSLLATQDYKGEERVQLSWDLGAITEKEKKQTIKAWCKALPELKAIRWLSVWSLVTQPLLDAVGAMSPLECLRFKWTNVKALDGISKQTELKYLHIGSSTKVQSIEPLAALSKLRLLELENFKLIDDFSPLLSLKRLESLVVNGSMWTRQDVGPLDAFAKMTWLKSLAIDTAHVESLRPLANLKQLQTLDMGGKLPLQEYAWLSTKLPNTECRWFKPYLDVAGAGFLPCEKCKQDSKVILTGKGGKLLCRVCEKDKVEKQVRAFEVAREEAMRE